MSEAAAVAAPAAPTNGATPGATQEAPPPSNGRGPDGKFAKVTPEAPKAEEKAPEEWWYEDELDVKGQKQKVRMSKEELRRDLQISKDLQRRAGEIARQQREWQQREKLAKDDPFAAMAAMGASEEMVVERATQMLLERAKLDAMSDEQRQMHTLQQENERLKSDWEKHQKAQAEQARATKQQQLVDNNLSQFTEALEAAKLSKSPTTLYDMVTLQEMRLRNGLPKFAPKELAAEAHKLQAGRTTEVFNGMEDEPLLEAVGNDLALRIVRAHAKRFEARRAQNQMSGGQPAPETPKQQPSKWVNESEQEARFAALKKSFR